MDTVCKSVQRKQEEFQSGGGRAVQLAGFSHKQMNVYMYNIYI